jgi:hypothetical protein
MRAGLIRAGMGVFDLSKRNLACLTKGEWLNDEVSTFSDSMCNVFSPCFLDWVFCHCVCFLQLPAPEQLKESALALALAGDQLLHVSPFLEK